MGQWTFAIRLKQDQNTPVVARVDADMCVFVTVT